MSAFTDNSNCHDISNDENDNNNGFNGNEDKQRCAEYHSQLVHEFVNITKENISKRIKELCYIINQNTNMVSLNTHHTHYMNMGHSNANNIEFQVNTPEFVNIAMSSITPVIQKHTIVQLGACKKIPKSKNEYKKVARNRLNRNKPKFLGNFVFAPLIFDQLYQFCGNIFQDHQMIVFVSILQDILAPTAVVRFEQTRAQPLIPYNTFVMENKFKNSCITLLRYYKLAKQWEIGSKKPNGKKETAKDVWNCFREMCLPKVAERCRNFSNTTPPNNLISGTVQFTTQNPIIPNSPNRDNMTQDRMSNDGMEYKHNDSHSEYQSMDDNSTQMSISTHHSLRHPQPQLAQHQPQQQQQLAMYPSLHLHYGDNSNSNSNSQSRRTVPFSYHVDNHMNNNNNNDNNIPPQLPLNLQPNNSYHSTHSRSSMYSSTINTSGVPSPVSSHFSSRRNSMIDTNNDLPPSVPTANMFNTFGSQSNQVMHGINNNNNNNNGNNHNDTNMALNSFSVMANDNFNTINTNHANNNVNDYGGNGIMNNMNNANNMIPNTNNDNIYGYNNNDNNSSSRNNTNDHLQINNNNNYGHITHNVYHQYNINQNNNDNRDNYQNCDNMTTSSNNSSNSSNSSSSDKTANASIENGNDNNETIQTLALPHILQMETSGDFMMNSPMTMNRFNSPNNNHQFSLSSPLATNNNGIDMMIMSPMTTNNNNNNGNNQQSVWMPNIENTDFDYSKVTEINSSFATFQ